MGRPGEFFPECLFFSFFPTIITIIEKSSGDQYDKTICLLW